MKIFFGIVAFLFVFAFLDSFWNLCTKTFPLERKPITQDTAVIVMLIELGMSIITMVLLFS